MRKSLRDIQKMERYLQELMPEQEKLEFQQRVLMDADFRQQLQYQKEVYQLVRHYSRRQLKLELSHLHKELIYTSNKTSLRNRIKAIFSKS